jgi:hypothetical protein
MDTDKKQTICENLCSSVGLFLLLPVYIKKMQTAKDWDADKR